MAQNKEIKEKGSHSILGSQRIPLPGLEPGSLGWEPSILTI